MNYLKVYVKLMRKASKQSSPKVYEKHHVFPKSIYGKNNYIVKLSPKQHYVAHALLYRGFAKRYGKNDPKTIKMFFAFRCMFMGNERQKRTYFNSRMWQTSRETYSQLMTSDHNPMRRKTHCEKERRYKLSEAMKGENNPFYGKKHSLETKQKLSDSLKEHYLTHSSPMKGKSMPEEAKQKLRIARLGSKLSDEHKQKISESTKNKKWFNNGYTETLSFECPDGYVKGRLKSRT